MQYKVVKILIINCNVLIFSSKNFRPNFKNLFFLKFGVQLGRRLFAYRPIFDDFCRMILEKELQFILEMDQLKNVIRRNFNLDDSRRENTAEHSWQVVLLSQILLPYANRREEIDLLRVIKMLTIHDVVEIKAGDTFLFDKKATVGKYEREEQAAIELFGLLEAPLSEEYLSLWREFEAVESPDAIFATAIDRIMPFILNTFSKGTSWTEAQVKKSQVEELVGEAVKKGSSELYELFQELLEKAEKEGKLQV